MFLTEAKVTVKGSDGKVQREQPYQKQVFHGDSLDKEGNVVLSNGTQPEDLLAQAIEFIQKNQKEGDKTSPIIELLAGYTYANDLGVRANIRQGIMASLEGPDKAIEKAATDFMKARSAVGKPVTIEQARTLVQQMLGL